MTKARMLNKLSFQGVLLLGVLALTTDGLEGLETGFVLVELFTESTGLAWFQVDWLDLFAAVELLELGLLGLVHHGEYFGDGLAYVVDLSQLGRTTGGDLGNAKVGELLAEASELFLEVFLVLTAKFRGLQRFLLSVSHFCFGVLLILKNL